MPDTFTLQIATPERVVLEEDVVSLVAPAYDGYLGVMARHAPLVAELRVGAMTATRPDGREELLAVSGGVLSVKDNVALVLADAAETAEAIDIERARAAEERARERLALPTSVAGREGIDVERAQMAIARAVNRIDVASRPS